MMRRVAENGSIAGMQKMAASLVASASRSHVTSAAVLPFHARGNVCVRVHVRAVYVADLCSCVCLSMHVYVSIPPSLSSFVSFYLY